ncbi:MAG: HD domain-containing protein [Bacilli bacterium]
MYTNIERAIHFAFIANKGQKRKNENIDFTFHPISVGMILKEYNFKDEIIITGILHDIIEDTNYSYEDIKKEFGEKIANNVLFISEDKNIKNPLERKKDIIKRLENADINILMVECADKLHNLISDYNLFQQIENKIWNRSLLSIDENKWFYKELLNIFKSNKEHNKELVQRYENIVNYYFK